MPTRGTSIASRTASASSTWSWKRPRGGIPGRLAFAAPVERDDPDAGPREYLRGRLLQRGHRMDVHDALRRVDGLVGPRRGVAETPDGGERGQQTRGKRSGEGDSERTGTPVAAVCSDTHLEPVDELGARLGPVGPELGLEAAVRISSPRSHSLSPPVVNFLTPLLPACLRFPYRGLGIVFQVGSQASERAVESDLDRVRLRRPGALRSGAR